MDHTQVSSALSIVPIANIKCKCTNWFGRVQDHIAHKSTGNTVVVSTLSWFFMSRIRSAFPYGVDNEAIGHTSFWISWWWTQLLECPLRSPGHEWTRRTCELIRVLSLGLPSSGTSGTWLFEIVHRNLYIYIPFFHRYIFFSRFPTSVKMIRSWCVIYPSILYIILHRFISVGCSKFKKLFQHLRVSKYFSNVTNYLISRKKSTSGRKK